MWYASVHSGACIVEMRGVIWWYLARFKYVGRGENSLARSTPTATITHTLIFTLITTAIELPNRSMRHARPERKCTDY